MNRRGMSMKDSIKEKLKKFSDGIKKFVKL